MSDILALAFLYAPIDGHSLLGYRAQASHRVQLALCISKAGRQQTPVEGLPGSVQSQIQRR